VHFGSLSPLNSVRISASPSHSTCRFICPSGCVFLSNSPLCQEPSHASRSSIASDTTSVRNNCPLGKNCKIHVISYVQTYSQWPLPNTIAKAPLCYLPFIRGALRICTSDLDSFSCRPRNNAMEMNYAGRYISPVPTETAPYYVPKELSIITEACG